MIYPSNNHHYRLLAPKVSKEIVLPLALAYAKEVLGGMYFCFLCTTPAEHPPACLNIIAEDITD